MPGRKQYKNRNRRLIRKRINDPDNWSYKDLGDDFGITRGRACQIFKRYLRKYATGEEIKKYNEWKEEASFG